MADRPKISAGAGIERLRAEPPPRLGELQDLWRDRDTADWAKNLESHRLLARRFRDQGEFLLTHDVASEGLTHHPDDVPLKQVLALALANCGAAVRASQVLGSLPADLEDEETLGLLARTYKDLWRTAAPGAEKERLLGEAADVYLAAHELTGGYWTAINAATMNALAGRRQKAEPLARDTKDRLSKLDTVDDGSTDRYWTLATLGEACLVLQEWEEAADYYGQAAQCEASGPWMRATTFRNARDLLESERPWSKFYKAKKEMMLEQLRKVLRLPTVVVFTGHMFDRPGRLAPRFPLHCKDEVYAAIQAHLEELDADIGYASAACGGDLLFHKAMLERKGKTNVFLPYNKEQFLEDSGRIINEADHEELFLQILRDGFDRTISPHRLAFGTASYEYTDRILLGAACQNAMKLEGRVVPLALWDGGPGDGPGGTASIVEMWRRLGHRAEIIDLKQVLRIRCGVEDGPGDGAPATEHERRTLQAQPADQPGDITNRIMALMFLDMVKFGSLTDKQIPAFIKHTLTAIAQVVADANVGPEISESRGDGYYFVFTNVRQAGEFALLLRDRLATEDWNEVDLPKDLAFRMSLHAGPVYFFTDPVTRQSTYTGTQVVKAARIEAVSGPGEIYASEAFVDLASAERVDSFVCEYVGQKELPKMDKFHPLYLVRRAITPEPVNPQGS